MRDLLGQRFWEFRRGAAVLRIFLRAWPAWKPFAFRRWGMISFGAGPLGVNAWGLGSALIRAGLIFLALLGYACGGAPSSGPSPVIAPSASASPVTAAPIPGWVDRSLLSIDSEGFVLRWKGGAMHHCLSGGVDKIQMEAVFQELQDLSGIPRTEAGPCNVEWTRMTDVGHSNTTVSGASQGISHATVILRDDSLATARHEGGHVLGLQHSTKEWDLMTENPRVEDFTPEECAVIAWLFSAHP